MASAAFGTKKRPAGKQYRNGGVVADALDDVYKDVEAGFVAVEKRLNQSTVNQLTVKGLAVGVFDPSGDTTMRTVGAHAFGPTLPIGAVITRAWYKTSTTLAGVVNATVAFGVTNDAEGLLAALAYTDGSFASTGQLTNTVADGALANIVPPPATVFGLAAAGQMLATVGTAALTAGKIIVYAEYIVLQ